MNLPIALAALFLQPHAMAPAAPAPAASGAIDYVILADEARRKRLEPLLARLAARDPRHRPGAEGGMYFVSCIGPWRQDRAQAEACMRSRLPEQNKGRTIILNTYLAAAPQIRIACVGLGGTGEALLGAKPRRGDAAALAACLEGARPDVPVQSVVPQWIGVNADDDPGLPDPDEARRSAKWVLLVAADHVGVPRGSTGDCLVQGRVIRSERGDGVAPGARIEAFVPCTSMRSATGPRRIWMGDIPEGGFARLYLDPRSRLVDYERVPTQPR